MISGCQHASGSSQTSCPGGVSLFLWILMFLVVNGISVPNQGLMSGELIAPGLVIVSRSLKWAEPKR